MANTLTSLLPDAYEAVDMVLRELTGFIPACTMDASASRAALNQTIRIPISPPSTVEDTTPGSIPPDTGDQSFDNTTITIAKSRTAPFRWTGEEQGQMNAGPGYTNLRRDQIAQAIRSLVNEVETDLALASYQNASRAYGTAGTAPFGSSPGIGDLAALRKILVDNGCPEADLQLVIDTTAGLNLRKLSNLYKVNEGGSDALLRQGVLTDLFGFAIRESAKVVAHTAGTGSGYLINLGNVAVGSTTLTVDTGSGTIKAGDVVTHASDSTNKYMVNSALASTTFGIGRPGLLVATANNDAITVGASFRANVGFHRSSLLLAARAPMTPEEGDMAVDRQLITDPRTGVTFEFAMYPQYRRVRYEVSLAWGTKGIKPETMAVLLG